MIYFEMTSTDDIMDTVDMYLGVISLNHTSFAGTHCIVILNQLSSSAIAGKEVAHGSSQEPQDESERSGSDDEPLVPEPDADISVVNWHGLGSMSFEAYANHCLPTRMRMSTTQRGLAPDWKAPFIHVISLHYGFVPFMSHMLGEDVCFKSWKCGPGHKAFPKCVLKVRDGYNNPKPVTGYWVRTIFDCMGRNCNVRIWQSIKVRNGT